MKILTISINHYLKNSKLDFGGPLCISNTLYFKQLVLCEKQQFAFVAIFRVYDKTYPIRIWTMKHRHQKHKFIMKTIDPVFFFFLLRRILKEQEVFGGCWKQKNILRHHEPPQKVVFIPKIFIQILYLQHSDLW